MQLTFYKYQGAGNDFVILNNQDNNLTNLLTKELIAHLCDRRFGIGADGLLLLSPSPNNTNNTNATNPTNAAFRMEYFNQDGSRASFCGNGARCICSFATYLGIVKDQTPFNFIADDGPHSAISNLKNNWVDLKMTDVNNITQEPDGAYVLNTGVPHYVKPVDNIDQIDLPKEAPKIRFAQRYQPNGVNVNFIHLDNPNTLSIRTYERGVEAETLACGTGITASALVASLITNQNDFTIKAKGGTLKVTFTKNPTTTTTHFQNIQLGGPATQVYKGTITI